MKTRKLLPIIAAVTILVAFASTLYVRMNAADTTEITVYGAGYSMDQLFGVAEARSIEDESGIALDDLMIQTGVEGPEGREYTLVGADGYQKTVQWENMGNGLLTMERKSVFSDLPKAFMVKDIIEIKVD